METCGVLLGTLVLLLVVVAVVKVKTRMTPEKIAEENRGAEKDALGWLQLHRKGIPVQKWMFFRSHEVLNWLSMHPGERLPKELRCSWNEAEKRLRKKQSDCLDRGDIVGWEQIRDEFEAY